MHKAAVSFFIIEAVRLVFIRPFRFAGAIKVRSPMKELELSDIHPSRLTRVVDRFFEWFLEPHNLPYKVYLGSLMHITRPSRSYCGSAW